MQVEKINFKVNSNLYNSNRFPSRKDNIVKQDFKQNNTFIYPSINLAYYPNISFSGINLREVNLIPELYGHLKEQKMMKEILLNPIINNAGEVKPFILLYSPTKEMTYLFSKWLKEELKETCKCRISQYLPSDEAIGIQTFISKNMDEGVSYYSKNKKRNIIFINNIEKYISTSLSDIDEDSHFTENDIKLLKSYQNENNNISFLKPIPDYCSHTPDKGGCATTIIMTSENPHLINHDLLYREGKMLTFPIGIDALPDIERTLRGAFHTARLKIRYLCMNPQEAGASSISFPLAKRILQDPKQVEDNSWRIGFRSPYYFISEFLLPNTKGGFSYKQIQNIVDDALEKTLSVGGDEEKYTKFLISSISSADRDIKPEVYKNFERIKGMTSLNSDEIDINPDAIFNNIVDIDLYPKEEIDNINRLIFQEFVKISESGSLKNNQKTFLKDFFNSPNEKFKKEFSTYVNSRIIDVGRGKYRFYYGDNKEDVIDLYKGSFGWDEKVLWIDSEKNKDIMLVRNFIENIKGIEYFKNVKSIEFPQTEDISKLENAIITERVTIDKQHIIKIPLNEQYKDQNSLH